MTLFLDFDGVLHAEPVFYDIRAGRPLLDPDLGELFEWAPVLERIMACYPALQIVLSTSWAARLGYEAAKGYLLPAIADRVVDCIWHESDGKLTSQDFHMLPRFRQIEQYVMRKKITHWLAIDDDAHGWPADQAFRLVHTNRLRGMSDESVQRELCVRLTAMEQ